MLTVTKSNCIWNKYTDNETMEITSSSGIYEFIYHNGCYLGLFGKRQGLSFQISDE